MNSFSEALDTILHVNCTATERCLFRKANKVEKKSFGLLSSQLKNIENRK